MSDPTEPQQDNARSLHDETRRYPWPHEVIKNYTLEAAQLMFCEGNPTGYVWDIDSTKTPIYIGDKYSFNLEQVGSQPAIVANRGPQQWGKSSGFRQVQKIDMRTDARTHIDLIRGGCVLSCFSRSGEEAEKLAGYLFMMFEAGRDVLRKLATRGIMAPSHLGFFKIDATTMGEEALVQATSRPEISVVPVAIAAQVTQRWSVTPKSNRKLRDIHVRTTRLG